jgi:general secretion pathway protein G
MSGRNRRETRPLSNARRGFTLIELLLVLVILAILAALVVPKFTKRSEQARDAAAKTDIAQISTAISAFEVDNGRYPKSDEGLKALVEQPGDLKQWHGPYIERGVPVDPWGHSYVYRSPGTHNTSSFDLYSMGPDGNEGGGDDIDNWTSAAGK